MSSRFETQESRKSYDVTVRGVTVRYQEHGRPDAPPLVLLHGLSASAESWAPVIDRFAAGWRVVAVDLRGHGASDHATGGYRLADYCDDVDAVLEQLGTPAVLVGHSLGAVVAAVLAATHPLVRAVFLEDPPLYVVEPAVFDGSPHADAFRGLHAAVARLQGEGHPVADYESLLGASPHPIGGTVADRLLPDALSARARALATMDPDAIAAMLDGRTFGGFSPDLRFRCPVTALRADPAGDTFFLPEHESRLVRSGADVTVELVSGSGHNIRGDRVGRHHYLASLGRFLDDLDIAGRDLREQVAVLPNGLRLVVADTGPSAGPTVVFVHGWPDSLHSFGPVMRHLSADVRMLSVSLRGFGGSEITDDGYDMGTFAGDVIGLLETLGIDRALFVGHSMGTLVVQRLALARPAAVLGLVLIGGLSALDGDVAAEIDAAVSQLSDPIDEQFVREFQAGTLAAPIAASLFDRIVEESRRAPAHVWQASFDAIRSTDTSADLPDIGAPVLLLWGDRDALVPRSEQERLRASIPDAQLIVYEGAGHSPNWERPAQVASDILAFLHTRLARVDATG